MSEIVAVALIAGVVGPSVIAILTWWLRRSEKKSDYEREDARELARQKREDAVAARVKEVAEEQRTNTERTHHQLDEIEKTGVITHKLVNSNMTGQMEDSLASKEAELTALEEIIRLNKLLGHEPSVQSLAVIETTKEAIIKKKAELADRLTNAEAIEEEGRIKTSFEHSSTPERSPE